MTAGYQQNKVRQETLASLGRILARRSGSCCELCRASRTSLHSVEIEPVPEQPDPDRTLFVCELCYEGVRGGQLLPPRWHFLETMVWSDIPVVQVAAVRLCRRLYADGVEWAGEVLDGLYLSPEVEEWVGF